MVGGVLCCEMDVSQVSQMCNDIKTMQWMEVAVAALWSRSRHYIHGEKMWCGGERVIVAFF